MKAENIAVVSKSGVPEDIAPGVVNILPITLREMEKFDPNIGIVIIHHNIGTGNRDTARGLAGLSGIRYIECGTHEVVRQVYEKLVNPSGKKDTTKPSQPVQIKTGPKPRKCFTETSAPAYIAEPTLPREQREFLGKEVRDWIHSNYNASNGTISEAMRLSELLNNDNISALTIYQYLKKKQY